MTPTTLPDTTEETGTSHTSQVDLMPPYKIIFLNDNETSMEFVVKILVGVFQKDQVTANELMMEIHNSGAAVITVLPFEEAELRQQQVHDAARAEGFPLRCLIEPT